MSALVEQEVAVEPPPPSPRPELGRPRFRFRDLVNESVAGMLARPLRASLTTLGTVLGVGALVATVGLSRTAGNQIVGRFSELQATQITVQPANSGGFFGGGDENRRVTRSLPWAVEDRLDRLNGVVASGALAEVDVRGALVRTVPLRDPTTVTEFQIPVLAASPGLLDAVRGEISTGRFFDQGHVARGDRVVVLGRDAATQLNLTRVDNVPALFIGEELYTVIGVLDDVSRQRKLLDAVILPSSTANARYDTVQPSDVVIETELGAAQLVASQAAIALNPNSPDELRVSAPVDPQRTQRGVENDVNSLFLVLGLVSLVVGAIGIMNVTLVTVLERVGEIGLRRALGAARRHIAAQFLLESTAMGFVGGVIGATAGLLVTVIVSANRNWTPVLDAWVPLAAPALGALVGMLAGLYPSLKAARMEPVEALRSGT
jgi:putative ABC transport system permease protein